VCMYMYIYIYIYIYIHARRQVFGGGCDKEVRGQVGVAFVNISNRSIID